MVREEVGEERGVGTNSSAMRKHGSSVPTDLVRGFLGTPSLPRELFQLPL